MVIVLTARHFLSPQIVTPDFQQFQGLLRRHGRGTTVAVNFFILTYLEG